MRDLCLTTIILCVYRIWSVPTGKFNLKIVKFLESAIFKINMPPMPTYAYPINVICSLFKNSIFSSYVSYIPHFFSPEPYPIINAKIAHMCFTLSILLSGLD